MTKRWEPYNGYDGGEWVTDNETVCEFLFGKDVYEPDNGYDGSAHYRTYGLFGKALDTMSQLPSMMHQRVKSCFKHANRENDPDDQPEQKLKRS